MTIVLLRLGLCATLLVLSRAWMLPSRARPASARYGILDAFFQRDFIKLEDAAALCGPGPMLVAYQMPRGIVDEEIYDMVDDVTGKSCVLARVENENDLLDRPLREALDVLFQNKGTADAPSPALLEQESEVPVLLFSGFANPDMMAVYNLLGREIYEETGGRANAACAKVVPKALDKPLRQVLDEIRGDHRDALQLEE